MKKQLLIIGFLAIVLFFVLGCQKQEDINSFTNVVNKCTPSPSNFCGKTRYFETLNLSDYNKTFCSEGSMPTIFFEFETPKNYSDCAIKYCYKRIVENMEFPDYCDRFCEIYYNKKTNELSDIPDSYSYKKIEC